MPTVERTIARHWLLLFLFITAPSCLPESAGQKHESLDLLITGGHVFVGLETELLRVDVGIRGDRIVETGELKSRYTARQTIDATGLVVAPGFIDPHTHSDLELQQFRSARLDHYLTQGVTTLMIGNDGRGPVDVQAAVASVKHSNPGPNVGIFVGHGSLRERVIGLADRAASREEVSAMRGLLRQGLDDGAFGLSSGLFYVPGSYAQTSEIIDLTRILKTSGGIYESHIRDESSYSVGLLAAVDETIEIGEATGVPVHISHIKALGVDVWGQSAQVIEKINAARSRGVAVTADQYPWQASGTRVGNALLSNWVKADSKEQMLQRLNDPELALRIDREMRDNLRRRGGADAILITDRRTQWAGQTLAQVAQTMNTSTVEAAKEIVRRGDAGIASFNMSPGDVEAFMRQSWVVTSSDGSNGHPRKFASFPEKYATWVTQKSVLSTARFIHQSSQFTAEILGLCGRGRIEAGYYADIVLFDPERFAPRADYSNPTELSTGVDWLLVNGDIAIRQGKLQDIRSGRVLNRTECSKG